MPVALVASVMSTAPSIPFARKKRSTTVGSTWMPSTMISAVMHLWVRIAPNNAALRCLRRRMALQVGGRMHAAARIGEERSFEMDAEGPGASVVGGAGRGHALDEVAEFAERV